MKKGRYLNLKINREISEDMNYRETGLCLLLWAGILFQILNLTLGVQTEKISRKPLKCQWKCQLMTGCVKRWNGKIVWQ